MNNEDNKPLTREEVREIVREEIAALAVSIGRLQHVLITLGGATGRPFLDAATELLKEAAPEQPRD